MMCLTMTIFSITLKYPYCFAFLVKFIQIAIYAPYNGGTQSAHS